MRNLEDIKKQQIKFIEECNFKAKRFIKSICLDDIDVILQSGSVARGDFMPGKLGGMIDLTIMKTKGSNVTATELFGEDEEPEIPYHCVRHLGQWFSIAFHEFIDNFEFEKFDEPKKFAILESKILLDKDDKYSKVLVEINSGLQTKLDTEKNKTIGYINYLLSEYKTSRWISREANPQLHANLNTAIQACLKGIYYNNSKYTPAEDRRFYYSFTLTKIPDNYEKIVSELFKQDIMSYDDYIRRENIFNKLFLPIISM